MLTRDDFEQMWYGSTLPEEQRPVNGCVLLFIIMTLVWIGVGVGIWWAVTR